MMVRLGTSILALVFIVSLLGALVAAGLASAAPPTGTAGDDDLEGTRVADAIDGLKGDDAIDGKGGDDVLRGGAGRDVLLGRGGDDDLDGGGGSDRVHGGLGTDTLTGGKQLDRLYGGGGDDTLHGGAGNDLLVGDPRNSSGDDTLRGDEGDDVILGRAGADELQGGPGRDRLEGGSGADRIIHVYAANRDNRDNYRGGRGDDTLRIVISSEDIEALGTTRRAIEDHFAATAPGTVRFRQLGIDLALSVTGIEHLEIGPSIRGIEASRADINVDGDTADWAGVAGIDIALEAIRGRDEQSTEVSVKVAHDNVFAYVLLEVDDDYDWNPRNAHMSAASAVMWSIDPLAGPHMGADDPRGIPGIGTVDIWHWELECASGEEHGGAVSGPGDGDPGNDAGCNLDDEWSNNPFAREDDNGPGAENSLLGVWAHTNPVDGASGTWIFELRRPLQTGDEQDGQFAPGETAQLAIAYWDPDQGPSGWADSGHVQSSNRGWIDVTFAR